MKCHMFTRRWFFYEAEREHPVVLHAIGSHYFLYATGRRSHRAGFSTTSHRLCAARNHSSRPLWHRMTPSLYLGHIASAKCKKGNTRLSLGPQMRSCHSYSSVGPSPLLPPRSNVEDLMSYCLIRPLCTNHKHLLQIAFSLDVVYHSPHS